ncbi:hypothetical protein [Haladaptatus sp. CMSO5]|uniref:hypothetical protein n=1 Tax=Haladaptatus sp. CMSO5 TaxID=3120514 RepID=UPI002FCE0370
MDIRTSGFWSTLLAGTILVFGGYGILTVSYPHVSTGRFGGLIFGILSYGIVAGLAGSGAYSFSHIQTSRPRLGVVVGLLVVLAGIGFTSLNHPLFGPLIVSGGFGMLLSAAKRFDSRIPTGVRPIAALTVGVYSLLFVAGIIRYPFIGPVIDYFSSFGLVLPVLFVAIVYLIATAPSTTTYLPRGLISVGLLAGTLGTMSGGIGCMPTNSLLPVTAKSLEFYGTAIHYRTGIMSCTVRPDIMVIGAGLALVILGVVLARTTRRTPKLARA